MNVKLVFADGIDSWDTRADGSASVSRSTLCVRSQCLCLRSALTFEEFENSGSNGNTAELKRSWTENGSWKTILTIQSPNPPKDIIEWLSVAHDELKLLRLDVDGETFYEFAEPDEDDGATYEYDGQKEEEKVFDAFDVSDTVAYDHMHPSTAALKAAVNRYQSTL